MKSRPLFIQKVCIPDSMMRKIIFSPHIQLSNISVKKKQQKNSDILKAHFEITHFIKPILGNTTEAQ